MIADKCPCGTTRNAKWTDHNHFNHDCIHHGHCTTCQQATTMVRDIETYLASLKPEPGGTEG